MIEKGHFSRGMSLLGYFPLSAVNVEYKGLMLTGETLVPYELSVCLSVCLSVFVSVYSSVRTYVRARLVTSIPLRTQFKLYTRVTRIETKCGV